MATVIKPKRSNTSASIPTTSDLADGEMAVNTADGKIYVREGSEIKVVANVSSGSSGEDGGADITLTQYKYTASANQTTFSGADDASQTLSYSGTNIIVTLNGSLLEFGTDYTATDGTSIVLASGAAVNDDVNIISISGTSGGSTLALADLTNATVGGHLIPTADVTYDLGSADYRFRDIFLSGSTINLGGATISQDAGSGTIALVSAPTVDNPNPKALVVTATGSTVAVDTAGGTVDFDDVETEIASNPGFDGAFSSLTGATNLQAFAEEFTLPTSDGSADQVLTTDGSGTLSFATASGGGVTVYATIGDIPLSNNTAGDLAFVSGTNKLYLWNGSGWYNIALINQTPTITSGGAGSYELAIDGTATVITLVAEDPEGFPVTWSYQVTSGTLGNTATITQADNVFTITPSTNIADAGEFSLTFSATDGNNITTDVNSFTLQFASPLWKNVSLNLGTSTTSGVTNNSFIDRSSNAHTVTAGGNASQSAFHPYLDNWGVEFDGSGDYLSVPNDASLDLGTGDFTVEFWLWTDNTDTKSLISSSGSGGMSIGYTSNTIRLGRVPFTSTSDITFTGSSLAVYQWNHIAIARNASIGAGSTTLWINGNLIHTGTSTNSYNFTGNLQLGIENISNWALNGYLSNVRIVKGTAVYDSSAGNFTPPTEKLTAISGTSLLTCQSNRFIDNSSNDHTIAVNGDPKVLAYNPFGQESEYAIGANKGSAYFDGDDYIDVGDSGETGFSFDGDFTIEFWYYPEELDSTQKGIMGVATRGSGAFTLRATSSGIVIDRLASALDLTATWPGIPYQWYHIAIVRSGSVTSAYINGEAAAQTGSYTGTYAFSTILRIGDYDTLTGTLGYLTDIKIVKGTAVYTSNFTPPTTPVGSSNASAYLPMDNAGIFDKTGTNKLTLYSNTSTSTTQTKFADTSVYFDGSGDYIEVDADVMAFGTGDFTIEAWIYPTTTGRGIFRNTTSTAAGTIPGVSLYFSSNLYYLAIANSSSSGITLSASHSWGNKWSHIALTRESGTARFFIDGVLSDSDTSTQNLDTGVTLRIGEWRNSSEFYQGYIENFQVLKGVAKYTTAFTPPTLTQGASNQIES